MIMGRTLVALFLLILPLSEATNPNLNQMTPSEIYVRCYRQLTGRTPLDGDPLLAQIKGGALAPAEACSAVLAKANFSSSNNTRIADPADPIAKAVLKRMHDVHFTWFKNRLLNQNGCFDVGANNIIDSTTPAMYFTKSLFDSQFSFEKILEGSNSVEAIRSEVSPNVGPFNGTPARDASGAATYKSGFMSTDPTIPNTYGDWSVAARSYDQLFAPVGELLGIQSPRPYVLTNTGVRYKNSPVSNIDLLTSRGGGILGNPVFFTENQYDMGANPDGAAKLHRNWSAAVLRDLLCRDLPSTRYSDGMIFVSTDPSAVAFRKGASCTQCHASLDRMAFATRNLLSLYAHNNGCNAPNLVSNFPVTSEKGPESEWPISSDAEFYLRPPRGVLYYRSFDGTLVNLEVSNLNDLGTKIQQLDDFYVCAAKRYYQYFTGVSVSLGDIDDPMSPIQLSEIDLFHRETVISLGRSLKEHRDPRRLLKEIWSLPVYSKRFPVKEGPQ